MKARIFLHHKNTLSMTIPSFSQGVLFLFICKIYNRSFICRQIYNQSSIPDFKMVAAGNIDRSRRLTAFVHMHRMFKFANDTMHIIYRFIQAAK